VSGTKIGYCETPSGPVDIRAPSSALAAWSPATGAWSLVTLLQRYFPLPCRWLPNRGTNNAGGVVAFPAPEAAALIAAGYATAAEGEASQQGNGP